MRNRIHELTQEEINEQMAYVHAAEQSDTVNKTPASRAAAALGRANHGGPHPFCVEDEPERNTKDAKPEHNS